MDWEKPLDDACFEEFNITCYGLGKAYFKNLNIEGRLRGEIANSWIIEAYKNYIREEFDIKNDKNNKKLVQKTAIQSVMLFSESIGYYCFYI